MATPMRLSWKLGQVAGIDLFLHPSALLMFFFASGAMASGLETIALVVALFGSIVLHELGHALMARRYGIGTADITLYVFGGVARLERMPRSAGPELLIALAGPAVNFAIVLALAAFTNLAALLGISAPEFLSIVLVLNLGLGLFNLLPIFPMDGGRVLRAVLSGPLGRVRATEIAATLGRILAVAGGIYFLASQNFLAAILALFVYLMGSMELRQVRAEGRPQGVPDGLVGVPPPPAGFRWVSRGDGVWRLAPIMVHVGGRDGSWS
jgi:Zn-dependent protease